MERLINFDFEDGVKTEAILLTRQNLLTIQAIWTGSDFTTGTPPKISISGSLDGTNYSGALLPLLATKDKIMQGASGSVFWVVETPINVKMLKVTIDPGSATEGTGQVFAFLS